MVKTIFVLGRQPELGIAELESLFGSQHEVIKFNQTTALVNREIEPELIDNLGGTTKIGQVLLEIDSKRWDEIHNYLLDKIVDTIVGLPEGKISIGLSCHGIEVRPKQLTGTALELKKSIKKAGRSIRVVPNNESSLSTAQVIHNKLTKETGFEILIVAGQFNTYIARTISVQDIDSYAARDQARPSRDARVGMLPPKLAQIMINLVNPDKNDRILDPFCGTGVVLQEGLLMGHDVYGTDLNDRMIEYSEKNLQWLKQHFRLGEVNWIVEQGDAQNHRWSEPIDAVVSEIYLGTPMFNELPITRIETEAKKISDLLEKFLTNLAKQTKSGTRISLAVPAWKHKNNIIGLSTLDHLEKIGYNHLSFKSVNTKQLIYHRPQQLVARQLLVLIRK